MISFSSDITNLSKLKSELCRMPIKPNANGLFEMYDKKTLMSAKFKLPSPNLADSVMMGLKKINSNNIKKKTTKRPKPIKPMGIRN